MIGTLIKTDVTCSLDLRGEHISLEDCNNIDLSDALEERKSWDDAASFCSTVENSVLAIVPNFDYNEFLFAHMMDRVENFANFNLFHSYSEFGLTISLCHFNNSNLDYRHK